MIDGDSNFKKEDQQKIVENLIANDFEVSDKGWVSMEFISIYCYFHHKIHQKFVLEELVPFLIELMTRKGYKKLPPNYKKHAHDLIFNLQVTILTFKN